MKLKLTKEPVLCSLAKIRSSALDMRLKRTQLLVTTLANGSEIVRQGVSRKVRAVLMAGLLCLALSGCQSSPGNAAVGFADYTPSGKEKIVRGVINGVYRYDPAKTLKSLNKYEKFLPEQQALAYSKRYIVRVGIDREPALLILSPIVIGADWADYVILPEGWTYDVHTISKDRNVLNVGDVVDISIQRGRRYDYVVSLVRKCFDQPAKGENPDWNIGCKTYDKFNEQDYAGEHYALRLF